jgi:SAM-dependent methyltransferase
MTPEFDEVVAAWDAAGNDDKNRSLAIHPSGRTASEYTASGMAAAEDVMRCAPPERYLRVGDFGCGNGRVTRWLPVLDPTAPNLPLVDALGSYHEVVAADGSAAMLDAARDLCRDDVTFCHSDGLDGNLPLLDCWYTSAVFIHHSYDDGARLLAALADATRHGGRVLLDVPVYDVARERQTWTDVTVWDREQFADAVAGAGLTVTAEAFDDGVFSFQHVGPNHAAFSVLDKP